jgi:hypothetical protein
MGRNLLKIYGLKYFNNGYIIFLLLIIYIIFDIEMGEFYYFYKIFFNMVNDFNFASNVDGFCMISIINVISFSRFYFYGKF